MASSKNDNQASFGSKRPRNDVSQKDGDWICTTCGNLNFAFRIACNKNDCHAPKPSGSLAPKSFGTETPKPFGSSISTPRPTGFSSSKPFIAPVRALATEIMSPYNGAMVTRPPPPPLPMYGMPINFGSIPSSIPYGSYETLAPRTFGPRTFGPRNSIQAGSSIPPRSFGAMPSTPPGSFGGVNPRPDINPYGYGFQGPSPWDAGLTRKDSEFHRNSEFLKNFKSHKNFELLKDSESHKNSESHKTSELSKDSKSRKDSEFSKEPESHKRRIEGPDGLSEGDWVCPRCENVNFAFRSKCNVKNCRVPRPTPMPLPVFPEGSWSCNKCGNMNYPYRNTCNMKGCRVEKTDN